MQKYSNWIRAIAATAASAALSVGAAPVGRSGDSYQNTPVVFEQNRGQARPEVKYLARGGGFGLFLTGDRTVLALREGNGAHRVSLSLQGAQPNRPLVGIEPAPSRSHYYSASGGRSSASTFNKVRQNGVYSGIDLVYYGTNRQLEYDFVVAPGANPSSIRLQFDGVSTMRVDDNGDLVLGVHGNELRQKRPVAYQTTDAGRRAVDASFRMIGRNAVAFNLGTYDRRQPLVIDPIISYSAYLGGSNYETGAAVAVDAGGNAYVAGQTLSADFPVTPGAADTTFGQGVLDAFVVKYSPSGSVLWSTYLGGSGGELANAIAVDSNSNVYVVGETASADFPVLSAAQASRSGVTDAFVAKFTTSGVLVYSTYLGGSGTETGRGVASDSAGNAYITGGTASADFPRVQTTPTYGGGTFDAYLAKIAPAGNTIVFSGFFGGAGSDVGAGIAVDGSGNVHIAGDSDSTNLPITGGSQTAPGGGLDAFVARFNSAGVRTFSTYLGGTSNDLARGIAVTSAGDAVVTGETASNNFPLASAIYNTFGGGTFDAFITRISSAGTVVFSTYLGGSSDDAGSAVAVDSAGRAYVAGRSISTNFPLLNSLKTPGGNYDAFVANLSPTGAALYITLIGGVGADVALAIASDTTGNAYVSGYTVSTDYPRTTAPTLNGQQDAFITKLLNCNLSLTPPGAALDAGGGLRVISVGTAAQCGWTATTAASWISFSGSSSGSGNGTLTLAVAPNPGNARSAIVDISGYQFIVTQTGSTSPGCTYTATPGSLSVPSTGSAGTISLTASSSGCNWSAYSSASWAQLFPLSGTGSLGVQYTIFPNFSTAVRNGSFTIGGRTVTFSQAASTLTANERFVQFVYFAFLGRLPTSQELAFQVANGLNGGRTQFVMNFYGTPEFNQAGRFVAGLYVGLLDRNAEYGGWLFQRNAMAVQGISQATLVGGFLGTPEYALKFGNPSNDEYVRLLYRYVLLREASPGEVAFHSGNLAGGQTRVQLAQNFLNSAEFQQGTGSRLTAFLLYATLLQRDASSTDFEQRVQQLNTGTPVATLVDQFLQTAEFNAQLQ